MVLCVAVMLTFGDGKEMGNAFGQASLTAIQLLWVNMIMNTLGALAATEHPTDELMERTPVGRKGNFITNFMWRNIMGQSYQFVVILYLQTRGKTTFHLDNSDSDLVLETLIFNSLSSVRCSMRSALERWRR